MAASLPLQIHALSIVRLLRPKQWIKNSFVLAPLIFTGQFLDADAVQNTLLATIMFCMASSAAYIVNDIVDIERDRQHPQKSVTRPLAAGLVTTPTALLLVTWLYASLIPGWFILPRVTEVIGAYLLLNIAYTFFFKHQPVADIFSIAISFVLRVYAGAMALDVPVSDWMFVTTLCLALYLAAIKRRQELRQNGSDSREVLEKYSVSLVDRYAEMSATGALVFYSMFVMSTKPQLVITVPLVLFGLFRYWYIVEELDDGASPTDAVTSDWQMLATIGIWAAACVWALWPAGI